MRAIVRLSVVLCAFLIAMSCASHLAWAEVRLGMSAAFNGPTRGLGIELYRGSMAYFDYINETEGGLFGQKIVLEALDDGYNPNPAIRNTIEFISQDDVLGLFNYVGTPTVTRVLPLLKKFSDKNILLFFPFTGAQPQREPPYAEYVFNLRASYRSETKGLVDKFVNLGRGRVAVFYQADAYGRSGWDGVHRALAGHSLDIVAEATYRRGASFATDMTRQVEILQQAKPDAVISIGTYEACAAFIRDARDLGLDAPIANVSFVGSESLLALLQHEGARKKRDYTKGLINTQVVPSYEDTSLPAVREYRSLMQTHAPRMPAVVREPYTPFNYSFVSFEGFLNAKTLVSAIKENGRIPDRAGMLAAFELMRDISIGIDTRVSFSIINHQGLDQVYYTTVEGGAFVPVADWDGWRK